MTSIVRQLESCVADGVQKDRIAEDIDRVVDDKASGMGRHPVSSKRSGRQTLAREDRVDDGSVHARYACLDSSLNNGIAKPIIWKSSMAVLI